MGDKKMHTPEEMQALRDEICTRIALGESVRKICESPHMPSPALVSFWVVDDPVFYEQYMRARRAQILHYADDLIKIADESTPEDVQVGRLRTDNRKWIASKLWPKVFGEKIKPDDDDKKETLSVNINLNNDN